MRDKKRKRKKEGDRMRRRDRRRQKPGVEDVGEKGGRRNCVCYSELTVCCGAERQWQTRITHMHAHMQWHTNMREQDYDLKHTVASSSPLHSRQVHTQNTHMHDCRGMRALISDARSRIQSKWYSMSSLLRKDILSHQVFWIFYSLTLRSENGPQSRWSRMF